LPAPIRRDVRALKAELSSRALRIQAFRGPLRPALRLLEAPAFGPVDRTGIIVTFTGPLVYAKAHHLPGQSARVGGRFAYAVYDLGTGTPTSFGVRPRPVVLSH